MDNHTTLTIMKDSSCPPWILDFASKENWQITAEGEVGSGLFFDDALRYTCSYGDLFFSFDKEFICHEKAQYSLKKEPLAKSLGLKKCKERQIVVDLTCGTAKDTLLLLAFGAEVYAFERNPIVYCLLQDALNRSRHQVFKFLHLFFGEASRKRVPENIHALYFDPMYPSKKKKSALPRKEMQIFKLLVGDDSDSMDSFLEFLKLSHRRFVVKRPLFAPILDGPFVDSFKGKTTRYDLYQNLRSELY